MAKLFQKLGYNYTDTRGDIPDLSVEAKEHLNSVPTIITDWQSGDIANSSVSGYFKNPTSVSVANILNSANTLRDTILTITSCTNVGVQDKLNMTVNILESNVSSNLYSNSANFVAHTNRISGVTNYITDATNNPDVAQAKPYYDNAMAVAKGLMYIIYQTDGIQNTAPIFGSFTSVFIDPELSQANTNIIANTVILSTSISGGGSCSLTLPQANTIYNNLANVISLMDTRKLHDENFYTNSRTLMDDFAKVRQFSSMGQSQTALIENYIGTDKLITRITS